MRLISTIFSIFLIYTLIPFNIHFGWYILIWLLISGFHYEQKWRLRYYAVFILPLVAAALINFVLKFFGVDVISAFSWAIGLFTFLSFGAFRQYNKNPIVLENNNYSSDPVWNSTAQIVRNAIYSQKDFEYTASKESVINNIINEVYKINILKGSSVKQKVFDSTENLEKEIEDFDNIIESLIRKYKLELDIKDVQFRADFDSHQLIAKRLGVLSESCVFNSYSLSKAGSIDVRNALNLYVENAAEDIKKFNDHTIGVKPMSLYDFYKKVKSQYEPWDLKTYTLIIHYFNRLCGIDSDVNEIRHDIRDELVSVNKLVSELKNLNIGDSYVQS